MLPRKPSGVVMATNSSIGYATYQQQDSSGAPSNDLVSIILFFAIIFVLFASFIFYFWYTEWHKVPAQRRREEELEHQKEIDQLVDNLKEQVKTVFRIPIVGLLVILLKGQWINHHYSEATPTVQLQQQPVLSHEHRKVLSLKVYHLFSVACLVAILIAIVILIGTVTSSVPSSSVLQAALFVLVLCINLYLITRQRCYYKERRQLFGNDDAHMNAVYKTCFNDWDAKMWSNWVQIAILVIEFFQLLTFPLRDLITVKTFASSDDDQQQQPEFIRLVSIVMDVGGLMPSMRTPAWYTYSVWTALAATLLSLLVALTVHCINLWRPYKIPNRWVHWCIPIASLLYIPILTTFVSSAACQSLNVESNDFTRTLRCYGPNISQQLYLWISLLGYIVAYFLLTIFLTSYERIPTHNEIAFKSISVAFIKNMGLLMAIVFLLVESTTNKNRMRAILSIAILLTMICYNIKAKPCYVDKINFFRTASFSCILWTSVLVAVLSDTNAAQSLGQIVVLCVIVGGWGMIVLLFLIIYFIYYKQPADYYVSDDERLDSSITATTEGHSHSPVSLALPGDDRPSMRSLVIVPGETNNRSIRQLPGLTKEGSMTDSNFADGWRDWASRLWSSKR